MVTECSISLIMNSSSEIHFAWTCDWFGSFN